jgi:hypothetical protein
MGVDTQALIIVLASDRPNAHPVPMPACVFQPVLDLAHRGEIRRRAGAVGSRRWQVIGFGVFAHHAIGGELPGEPRHALAHARKPRLSPRLYGEYRRSIRASSIADCFFMGNF